MDDRTSRERQATTALEEIFDEAVAGEIAQSMDVAELDHVIAAGTWEDLGKRGGRLVQLVLAHRTRWSDDPDVLIAAIEEAQLCYEGLFAKTGSSPR